MWNCCEVFAMLEKKPRVWNNGICLALHSEIYNLPWHRHFKAEAANWLLKVESHLPKCLVWPVWNLIFLCEFSI